MSADVKAEWNFEPSFIKSNKMGNRNSLAGSTDYTSLLVESIEYKQTDTHSFLYMYIDKLISLMSLNSSKFTFYDLIASAHDHQDALY